MQKPRVRWAAWLVPGTAALALGLMAPPLAGAQARVPVGAQFQVNTYTTSSQAHPSVTADADGDFVVVWMSNGSSGTDTTGFSIQGQRYASNRSTQGAQFQVNTYTTSYQYSGSVAADADGDFVVVWFSNGSSGSDTDTWSVLGQRYASNGSTQGAEFQVNSYTTGRQIYPSVAADADGDFVVAWFSYGSSGTDTSASSIQGQRYASDGSTQGAQFQVNTYTTSYQKSPSVAVHADGGFVVAWVSEGSYGTDTSWQSTQGQRYAPDGSTQGAQFQVNTYTTHYQGRPSVAVDADGDFVVVWNTYGTFGTGTNYYGNIRGQQYASDGSTQGAQFQVNVYLTNYQGRPSVAANADGDFVVVWQSRGSFGTDTDYSIQGRRGGLAPPVSATSRATRFALGAALLLLGAAVARAYGSVSRRSRFSR